jgi:pimeloyl-ACP methyl ester carboxylesterase
MPSTEIRRVCRCSISTDRPGYGLSDFYKKRKLLVWPGDVEELANALSIKDFSVLGVSGGGPYAAACAFKLPDRVINTAMVSSMGPADAPGSRKGVSWTLPAMPILLRQLILRLTSLGIRKDPGRFIERSTAMMAADDAALPGELRYAEAFWLDLNVTVSVSRNQADKIPDVSTTFNPKNGHLTMPQDYLREILTTMSGRA